MRNRPLCLIQYRSQQARKQAADRHLFCVLISINSTTSCHQEKTECYACQKTTGFSRFYANNLSNDISSSDPIMKEERKRWDGWKLPSKGTTREHWHLWTQWQLVKYKGLWVIGIEEFSMTKSFFNFCLLPNSVSPLGPHCLHAKPEVTTKSESSPEKIHCDILFLTLDGNLYQDQRQNVGMSLYLWWKGSRADFCSKILFLSLYSHNILLQQMLIWKLVSYLHTAMWL